MKISSYQYTANFCEENIWHLCQHPALANFDKKVMIISNQYRSCPLWHQQSAVGDEPVRWDYHVVLWVSSQSDFFVYDFDSTLDLPTSLADYLSKTFRPDSPTWEADQPLFKLIDAAAYTRSFYSDRRHMVDADENWIFSPPNWPLINNTGNLPLPELLNFSNSSLQPIFTYTDVAEMCNSNQKLIELI